MSYEHRQIGQAANVPSLTTRKAGPIGAALAALHGRVRLPDATRADAAVISAVRADMAAATASGGARCVRKCLTRCSNNADSAASCGAAAAYNLTALALATRPDDEARAAPARANANAFLALRKQAS